MVHLCTLTKMEVHFICDIMMHSLLTKKALQMSISICDWIRAKGTMFCTTLLCLLPMFQLWVKMVTQQHFLFVKS